MDVPSQSVSRGPLFRLAWVAAAPFYSLFQWRRLVKRFTIKELQDRYRNTFLGLFWFLVTPMLYLTAFSLVFGYIIPGRGAAWGHLGGGEFGFVLGIFSGLITFWLFSEVVGQAGNLITKNANLVSQVRFPTEVLPWVAAFCALVSLAAHLVFFAALYILWFDAIPWSILLLPFLLLPLMMVLTGLAWIVAAASVIVRDVAQFLQVGTTAMLFLSGVFYPAERIPEEFRTYFLLNPVARTIHDFRALVFDQQLPSLEGYIVYILLGGVVMALGYSFFKRLQPRFAEYL